MTMADLIIRVAVDPAGVLTGIGVTNRQLTGLEDRAKVTGARLDGVWKMMQKGATIALTVFGAVAVAVGKSMQTYQDYGTNLLQTQRMLGTTTEATSLLVNEWRLAGVEVNSGSQGMKFLQRNLYDARVAGSAQAQMFATLGINIKDANGNLLQADQVLPQVRDHMSTLTDVTERSALALKLFGRGGEALLPWLTKSNSEISKQDKLIAKLGLVWHGKQVKDFKDFLAAQNEMSLRWTALQIQLSTTFLPVLDKIMKVMSWIMDIARKVPAPIREWGLGLVIAGGVLGGILKTMQMMMWVATKIGLVKLFGGLFGGAAGAAGAGGAIGAGEGAVAATAGRGLLMRGLVSLGGVIAGLGATTIAAGLAATAGAVAIGWAWKQMHDAQDRQIAGMIELQKNLDSTTAHYMSAAHNFSAVQAQLIVQFGNSTTALNAIKAMSPNASYGEGKALIGQATYNAMGPGFFKNTIRGYANGGDFITHGPQVIQVGEGGVQEHVTVTPVGKGRGAVVNLNFHGPVYGGRSGIRELTEHVMDGIGEAVAGLSVAGG
jgi:hypothetical protein